MKKYLLLWVALIAALCMVWSVTIPDISMLVLLGIAFVFCIYAHFRSLNEIHCSDTSIK